MPRKRKGGSIGGHKIPKSEDLSLYPEPKPNRRSGKRRHAASDSLSSPSNSNNPNSPISSSSRNRHKLKRSKSKSKSKHTEPSANSSSNTNDTESQSEQQEVSCTMYAIPHHTSFLPALQCPNPLITPSSSLHSNLHSSALSLSNNTLLSNSKSSKSCTIASSAIPSLSLQQMMICNYNLFHPRNLSAQVIPHVTNLQPNNISNSNSSNGKSSGTGMSNGQSITTPVLKEQQTPHSAGCRMSSISCPTWTTIPQSNIQLPHLSPTSQSSPSSIPLLEDAEMIVKCTTVIHAQPKSEYIAMGDTAGYVTLYSKLPVLRPMTVLQTSSSTRYNLNQLRSSSGGGGGNGSSNNNGGNQEEDSSSNHNNSSSGSGRRTKRIGVTNNVLMSTIDRNFAIECIAVSGGNHNENDIGGVLVGTKLEVEYITLDDKIQWSLGVYDVCKDEFHNVGNTNDEKILGSDGIMIEEGNGDGKGKVMRNFVPKRFDIGNGGILASFELYHRIDRSQISQVVKKEEVGEEEPAKDEKDEKELSLSSTVTKTTTHENGQMKVDDDSSNDEYAKSDDDGSNDKNDKPVDDSSNDEFVKSDDDSSNEENDKPDNDSSNNANDNHNQDEKQKQPQSNNAASKNGHLVSPIWHIDTKSGKATNIIPKEYVNNKFQNVIIGHKAMAIWDKSIPDANNILAVCTTQDTVTKEIQQELLLLNNSQQIIFRANLPTRTSGSKVITCEAINQSQRGTFTIAATSARGGIRLFKTAGLVHLGTYGEGVSLHGHSIFWQDCFFIEMGNLNNDCASKDDFLKRKSNKSGSHDNGYDDEGDDGNSSCGQEQWGQIFERKDELRHRWARKSEEIEKIKSGEEESLKGLHIVSVPHPFREPVEMKETIHFWDTTTCELDGGNKLPSFTLSALKRSGGIINFLHDKSFPTSHGSRFLLSTYGGECVQLVPTMTSDWSGQMYPTGYRVIDNNLIYIEDEDELDKVIDAPFDRDGFCKTVDDSWEEPVRIKRDSDLEKALLISMVDEPVDVINDDSEDMDAFFISEVSGLKNNDAALFPPCRPEPRLKYKLNKTKDSKDDVSNSLGSLEEGSSSRNEAVDILRYFPQQGIVQDLLELEKVKSQKRLNLIDTKLAKANDAIKEKAPKPRTRVANIEAMINASVDKHLTVSMIERENFSGISGSMFTNKVQEGETENLLSKLKTICAACRGRKVLHSCGKRVKPIDYDAIEKARKEKEEKERKAKLQAQAKKRREADAKRREAKKKQKEEEKRAKLEEERIEKEMVERARNALIDAQSSDEENLDEEEREKEMAEEEERIKKEMAEQARNALVDTQLSYQENLEEEERIKKEMAEQARNALTDTHSSFHETVDPRPLYHSNNENQSVASQSMVSNQEYQLTETPKNQHHRHVKNEDHSDAPSLEFNQFSPLQPRSNLDNGDHRYELEANHREHNNHHPSKSISPQPQKYQGQKTESYSSHDTYHHNRSSESSYYNNQHYRTQQSQNKYPVSESNHEQNFNNNNQHYNSQQSENNYLVSKSNHEQNFNNQDSYMNTSYGYHNNHTELPRHHHSQQNYQMQQHHHQQHHPHQQQYYTSHNVTHGYDSNVYYNGQGGDSVAHYQSKHQAYSHNDGTHRYGENNSSNMNGSYFQETQQKPYYHTYSNTPVFSREISTAKSNGEFTSNNNIRPN